ncbi:MAG TPA: hypothetical protein DE045_09300 [Oceanospirillaceae bacterium]|nr:hypothetical protein [Oceanospirillaceae bacterium]
MKSQVLLVEDDEMCQEIVAEFLSELDVDVVVVGDGIQALAALEAHHFNVILMDIMMPHMDGIEATTKIRALADPSKAKTPVIAITARNPDTDQEIWFAIGVNDFVGKPFSEEEFIQVVSPYI